MSEKSKRAPATGALHTRWWLSPRRPDLEVSLFNSGAGASYKNTMCEVLEGLGAWILPVPKIPAPTINKLRGYIALSKDHSERDCPFPASIVDWRMKPARSVLARNCLEHCFEIRVPLQIRETERLKLSDY